MRAVRITCIILLTLLLLNPRAFSQRKDLGFNLPEGRQQYTIPFELINNLIVVRVVMNNTLPLKFIVDTGVRTSILTEKTFSDLLNVSYTRKVTIPGAGGEKLVDAYVAPNMTLNISGVVGRGHALLVLERDLLQLKNFLGHNVQGILGYELFSRFIIDIDYQKEVMTLYEPEAFAKRNLAAKRRWHQMPITVEDTKPYCYTKIVLSNGSELQAKLMMDTGASHAVLLDKDSHDEINIPNRNIESNLGRGLAGDINGRISRINGLEVNDFYFENVIATFPDKLTYEQEYDRVYRNGTMGGGVFTRFRIVFDMVSGYVYMKKNRKFNEPFDYNMSGIIVKAEGLYLKEFTISEVRKNSSAEEAGVLAGDVIIRVNNFEAEELELSEINGLFNSRPNRTIKLELRREGKYIRKKFQLRRLI